jgi:hypothetical protein
MCSNCAEVQTHFKKTLAVFKAEIAATPLPAPLPTPKTAELVTSMFSTKLHYDHWLTVTSPYRITVLKGDHAKKAENQAFVSKGSLTLIQSPIGAMLLSWTGSFATVVAKIKITAEIVTVIVTDKSYFSPQKLKMLNCVSTAAQWNKAVDSMRPTRGTILKSVVMKVTAWKGKANVWFEITTSTANPTAHLYFRAARKAKGERFSKLMDGYQKWSAQRPVTTTTARYFNHTQAPKVSRYSWDEMTDGMKPVFVAAK